MRRWNAGWLLPGLLLLSLPPSARANVAEDDARRAQLRSEMAEALERRQQILEQILAIGSGLAPAELGPSEAEPVEFHRASGAVPLAEPPVDAFDQALVAGPWPWSDELLLIEWRLDLDADGRPEEIRYLHPASSVLLRRHVDRNLDGKMDAWIAYREGQLFEQHLDDDHDGRIDALERYVGGVLAWREVDREQDGTMDVRRLYRDDWLAEERFDPDHDGVPNLVVFYRDGEVSERHHDVDGDGVMDVVSIYDGGRLLRREVRSQDVEIELLQQAP